MRALLALLTVVLLALPAAAAPMSVEYHSDSDACLGADAVPLPATEVCEVVQGGAVHLGGCIPTECILHIDVDVQGRGPPGEHLVAWEAQWDDDAPEVLCQFNRLVTSGGLGCIVFVWMIGFVAADECRVLSLRATYDVNLLLVAHTVDRFELCRDASGEATLRALP